MTLWKVTEDELETEKGKLRVRTMSLWNEYTPGAIGPRLVLGTFIHNDGGQEHAAILAALESL